MARPLSDLATVLGLPEAEETVRAIHHGAVDAIVVQGPLGPQIVTLSGAEEPYRVLVERMNDGAITLSSDGTILYGNQRLSDMIGVPVHDIIGKPFASLFTGQIPANWSSFLRPSEGGIRTEALLAGSKGPDMPVSVWLGPISIGDLPATLVTITDLSVQRRAEQIAAAERFARSILEQATDAILVLDRSGRITHASDAAGQISKAPPVGLRFSEAFPLAAASIAQQAVLERFSSDIIDTLLATKIVHGVEVKLASISLENRTFLLSAGPLVDEAKISVGSIVTLTDITARKRAEELQTMMVAELNHRVKNILAIVQSVAVQTVRNTSTLDTFSETFSGRLRALSSAHDILTRTRWGGVPLKPLLEASVAAYPGRINLEGPDVTLASHAVVPLSMVLHELMTNAAKYGALSASGSVEVRWQEISSGGTPKVRLTWIEKGGPPVKPATGKGFGTKLIERVMNYDLEGEAALDYRPEGLQCVLEFPVETEREPARLPQSAIVA